MNFLEASVLKNEANIYSPVEIGFYMSGLFSPLEIYLKGFFSKNKINIVIKYSEFGTLAQNIILNNLQEESIVLICPWDLIPELDWRSGISPYQESSGNNTKIKDRLINKLKDLKVAIYYLPAPVPPLFDNEKSNSMMVEELIISMMDIGAKILPKHLFSLKNYLDIGCPIHVKSYFKISEIITKDFLLSTRQKPKKIIVTDFDGVLWNGVIGDDEINSIEYTQNSTGFPHYIFQTFLKNLRQRGILLCGVTRNNPDVAKQPFDGNKMVLNDDDFVSVLASYNSKSEQIKLLSEKLSLGLDSFIFVDDNELEIAEVSKAIPDVKCVIFPSTLDDFPNFIENLFNLFKFKEITNEDRERTELYKRRLKGIVPRNSPGSNIFDFLENLNMKLTIHDKSKLDWTRALQLINKTNQFNMNGNQFSDEQIQEIINSGGYIYSATLDDKSGSHGEILSFLIDENSVVRSFVMSCRVLQREVEYFFLYWILKNHKVEYFEYKYTGRNDMFKKGIVEYLSPYSKSKSTIDADALYKYIERHKYLMKIVSL